MHYIKTGRVKFVALADVSDKQAARAHELLPDANKYRDFRDIYDKHLGKLTRFLCYPGSYTCRNLFALHACGQACLCREAIDAQYP